MLLKREKEGDKIEEEKERRKSLCTRGKTSVAFWELGLCLIINKLLKLPSVVGSNISWTETLTVSIPYSGGFYRHS